METGHLWPLPRLVPGVILLAGETSDGWNPGVQRLVMDRYPFPMHTAFLIPHPRWTHLFKEVFFQDDIKIKLLLRSSPVTFSLRSSGKRFVLNPDNDFSP